MFSWRSIRKIPLHAGFMSSSALPRSANARLTMPRPGAAAPRRLSCAAIFASSPVRGAERTREDCMTEVEKSLEELCVERGMRMTDQRRVIARVLEASADHPDVEELYRRSSAVDSRISISTVYRTVKLFEDAGIIERHDFRDGRS